MSPRFCCVDIETTGLNWTDRVLSVGTSWRNGDGNIHSKVWLVTAHDLFHNRTPIPQIRAELLPIINQCDLVTGHNFVFDLSRLFKLGVLIPDDIRGKLFDTLLTARMTGPHEWHNLDHLCGEYKIGTPQWRAMKENRGALTKVGIEQLIRYNAEDTHNNVLLAEQLYEVGEKIYDPSFMIQESEFVRVTAEMQLRGIELDGDKTLDRIEKVRKKKKVIFQQYLWNNRIEGPNDKTGLEKWLHENDIHDFKVTAKGNTSFTEEAIDDLIYNLATRCDAILDSTGNPLVEEVYYDPKKKRVKRQLSPKIENIVNVLDAVLACRGWEKEISTWLEPLVKLHAIEDGRIHANYSVGGATSYRYRCSDPGLQAFPKKLDIWESHKKGDYSQAEYKLGALYTAYLTGDMTLAEKYAQGFDAHTITAMEIYKSAEVTPDQRRVGKTVNFASSYFVGPAKLARQMGVTVEEAKHFLDLYRTNMRSSFQTAQRVNQLWVQRGYIKLWDGTRIWKGPYSEDYIGWNQLMQGGVAKMAKAAMMRADREGLKVIGQTHDELKFSEDTDPEAAYECMFEALPLEIRQWATPQIDMRVDGLLNQ